jgi:hypothetical protein
VLRFYGYDLDGATNMLTESKMNETFGNTTGVTEAAADTTVITVENETKDEEESDTTTLQPETSDTTDEVSGTETNTEDNAQSDDVNEEVTTVAPPSRKRRGRLERGLKAKMNRRDRKQQTIKSPVSRRSRSYYVLFDEDYDNEFNLDLPPPTVVPLGSSSTELNPASPTRQPIGKYRKNHPKDLFENNANTDTIEHIFYLNDYDTLRIQYKVYDQILKYGYISSLQASIIEIDLDSEYYNLIIIVPDFLDGLSNTTRNLRLHEPNTLREIRNKLDFHWVKTAVPKFNLKGTTILTNDLQNVSQHVGITFQRKALIQKMTKC